MIDELPDDIEIKNKLKKLLDSYPEGAYLTFAKNIRIYIERIIKEEDKT